MIELKVALKRDIEILTEIQIRTFVDDNKLKPPGCSLEGPPGYNSVKWNSHWIQKHALLQNPVQRTDRRRVDPLR